RAKTGRDVALGREGNKNPNGKQDAWRNIRTLIRSNTSFTRQKSGSKPRRSPANDLKATGKAGRSSMPSLNMLFRGRLASLDQLYCVGFAQLIIHGIPERSTGSPDRVAHPSSSTAI